jgi:predicted heme/steroid binding protein/uncharacterized membrane protein
LRPHRLEACTTKDFKISPREAKLPKTLKEFSLEELAGCNGAAGKPIYLAYQGKVYDVSGSALWANGRHMGSHQAGGDLTEELPDAPHGEEVLARYPQVGVLKPQEEPRAAAGEPEAGAASAREFWEGVFRRAPLLRRHPHPMVVHFPLVFFISTTIFTLLHLLTGVKSLEVTGFHCLGGGVLFAPAAIVTGLFTWWVNYQARPLRPVIIKIILSPILLAVGAGAFAWRWLQPGILAEPGHWPGIVYLALICSLTPLVSIVGWYGGTLTFPLHEE